MFVRKLYGPANNPIYAKHKPLEEMTEQEYADWWCSIIDWSGVEGLARLHAERTNPPSVPSVRRH